MKKYFLLLCCLLWAGYTAVAHPMPGSVVHLSVLDNAIDGEARIPRIELGNAVGDQRLADLNDLFFKTYFSRHIRAFSAGKPWETEIENIGLVTGQDSVIGNYQEVVVRFTLTPPDTRYLRKFSFNYDAVIHQVVTHSALVYVQQDWNNGIQTEGEARQIGIIKLDIPTEKIFPLEVNLQQGSWWIGATGMIKAGMDHIKEGTDHLLFIIVLLFPAMLTVQQDKWNHFGGVKYSLLRLLKIVTAFTIGHSVTLILGASNLIRLPAQPVEILIAVSILISAMHAIRPIFPGKETFIAAGFGLIHGLAFASVLYNLNLGATKLALSILGFNLGIELMQVLVIAIIIPWLLLLAVTPVYKWVRLGGAVLASIAAIAWIIQRVSGNANPITELLDDFTNYGLWSIGSLALFAVCIYGSNLPKAKPTPLADAL